MKKEAGPYGQVVGSSNYERVTRDGHLNSFYNRLGSTQEIQEGYS
jgi:hypothetical protein